MIDKTELLLGFTVKEKVELFKQLYAELSGYGQDGDTELAHVNPYEVALLKSVGGSGTVNSITGLREYKGGGSAPAPAPTTQTVKQETTIPEELKPYVKDILAESQAQFQAEKAAGYTPYAGQQLATFTPEQQQAFEATRTAFGEGLAGTPLGASTTYFAPALGATTAATMPTTAENIRAYMDPYLENVLRVQEQEARRADEISRQGRAAQAIQAGAFGGSREAVVEAESQRALEDRLASLRATGMSQAFGTAQQLAEAQRQRELTAGRQYAALGTEAAAQQAREIGGLAATGEALRGQQQAALDLAKSQFVEERAFPQTQLQQYSSIIRGFPLTPSQLQTTQTVTPQPSLTQQLLGAGIGAAGLAGAFGAFKGVKEGGLVGLAGGGRPMDAEPKRSRAELMGTAIGDLAGRMGAGRESVTSGGLRSMAPKMLAEPSFGMDDMPQEMQTATPMQMPSQRFMNEGGKVGYYQAGTLGTTLTPFSAKIQAPPSLTGIEGLTTPITSGVFPQGGQPEFQRTLEAGQAREAAALAGAQRKAGAAEMLVKGVPETERLRQRLMEQESAITGLKQTAKEESEKDKDLIASEKWATLLNIGANIANPKNGTKGFLADVTTAVSSEVDSFKDIARRERQLSRDLRKELSDIDQKELDIIAKQQGISSDALKNRVQAEITVADLNTNLAAEREKTLANVQTLREKAAKLQGEERDRAIEDAKTAAKKASDAQIKSAEFNAIQDAAYAAAYEGSFYTDETGQRRYAGDKNKLAQPEYKQKEAEMKLAAAQAFEYARNHPEVGDAFPFTQKVIEALRSIPVEEKGKRTPGRYSFEKAIEILSQATEKKEVVYGTRSDGTFGPLP